METDLQNAFGKSIGEVARDIADFLSTPFVIGAEHPVELCSLIEGLNMHGQFSFALLSEALAGGMTLAEAEAFYLRVCAPLIDDEIVRQTLAAFRDRESEDYRTLLQKYGNDFHALDGSYWATVLSVAIDADEVERVLSYLRAFTVTLLSFAYMEGRNPTSTYSFCYYEAFSEALASFAVVDEAPLPLCVGRIGGTRGKQTDGAYDLTLGAEIKNPNVGKMARGVSVDVHLKDKEGAILATVRERIQSIDPDTTYHYAVTKRITGGSVASIAVNARASSYLSLSTPIMHHVTISDVQTETRADGTYLTATVKNGYDRPLDSLTVHYQYQNENGKPLGGTSEWLLTRLAAGEERTLTSRVPVPIGGIANVAYSVDFDALTLVID